jgi:hypothetical protein
MKHRIWKLSMGPHAGGGEFRTLTDVERCLEEEKRVAVWGPTGCKGGSRVPQGKQFKEAADDDFFYLCHGNEEPGIILFGQFDGPAERMSVPGWRSRWFGRRFRSIRKARVTKKFEGDNKWWAPNHNSTFVSIPERDLAAFEAAILQPFFGLTLAALRRR